MKIYQKYQGRQKSTFKISKYVIILSTDLNITRLECKFTWQYFKSCIQYNLNITRLECKFVPPTLQSSIFQEFEYHQIGM